MLAIVFALSMVSTSALANGANKICNGNGSCSGGTTPSNVTNTIQQTVALV